MSHFANYAIKRAGSFELFSDRWGALTVPRAMSLGPAACERFIRTRIPEPEREWLGFGEVEGGIALDADRRRAVFFGGGETVQRAPEVQARLVALVQAAWPGWEIAWAARLAYDVLELVGEPPIRCDEYLEPPRSESPTDARMLEADPTYVATLVVRGRGPGCDTRWCSDPAISVARLGPKLLDAADALPRLTTPLAIDDQWRVTALVLDAARRSLVLVAPLVAYPNAPYVLLEEAREHFEGWSVELDVDRSSTHERLRARGIDVPAIECATAQPLGEDEIQSVVAHVLRLELDEGSESP